MFESIKNSILSITSYHGIFTLDLVILLVSIIIIVPYCFFNIRTLVPHPVKTTLTLTDYYIISILLVYIVIGVYQQYFWTKQNKLKKEVIVPKTILDEWLSKFISVNDNWTYIYNFIYYFVFGFIIISIRDYKHFAVIVLGAIAMMTGLSIIWYLVPSIVEPRMQPQNYFLQKTQLIDTNHNNACPSAHVVFAMYSFYLLRDVIGYIPAILIPSSISISCITTTQHVTTDVIFGLVYTVLFYNFILKKLSPTYFK
jgi:hypothetical protein